MQNAISVNAWRLYIKNINIIDVICNFKKISKTVRGGDYHKVGDFIEPNFRKGLEEFRTYLKYIPALYILGRMQG